MYYLSADKTTSSLAYFTFNAHNVSFLKPDVARKNFRYRSYHIAKLIRKIPEKYEDKKLSESQGNFRRRRSRVDHVFIMEQIQNNSYKQNLGLRTLFINFKQTYDSISKEMLHAALMRLGYPRKIITS